MASIIKKSKMTCKHKILHVFPLFWEIFFSFKRPKTPKNGLIFLHKSIYVTGKSDQFRFSWKKTDFLITYIENDFIEIR